MREWTQDNKRMHDGTHVPLCVNLCWRTHETDEYEAQASKAHHSQKEKTLGDSANSNKKAFGIGPEQKKPPTAEADGLNLKLCAACRGRGHARGCGLG